MERPARQVFRSVMAALALMAMSSNAMAAAVTVFSTDFNGSLPSEITPGTAILTGVAGLCGPWPDRQSVRRQRPAQCDRQRRDADAERPSRAYGVEYRVPVCCNRFAGRHGHLPAG